MKDGRLLTDSLHTALDFAKIVEDYGIAKNNKLSVGKFIPTGLEAIEDILKYCPHLEDGKVRVVNALRILCKCSLMKARAFMCQGLYRIIHCCSKITEEELGKEASKLFSIPVSSRTRSKMDETKEIEYTKYTLPLELLVIYAENTHSDIEETTNGVFAHVDTILHIYSASQDEDDDSYSPRVKIDDLIAECKSRCKSRCKSTL